MPYESKTTYLEIDECLYPGRDDCQRVSLEDLGERGVRVTTCLRCERLDGERANGEYADQDERDDDG